jgi:hypothetical protein
MLLTRHGQIGRRLADIQNEFAIAVIALIPAVRNSLALATFSLKLLIWFRISSRFSNVTALIRFYCIKRQLISDLISEIADEQSV